jgi:hypothetical protein
MRRCGNDSLSYGIKPRCNGKTTLYGLAKSTVYVKIDEGDGIVEEGDVDGLPPSPVDKRSEILDQKLLPCFKFGRKKRKSVQQSGCP